MQSALRKLIPTLACAMLLGIGCSGSSESETASADGASPGEITLYSGRSKSLVEPIIEKFEAETGIEVKVKYGGSAEMASLILEEGAASPADVFYSQDAGALGALAAEGILVALPAALLDKVDERFRSPEGRWVGSSGRARTVVYNTDKVDPADLPDSILGFTDPKWKGKIGWAPSNGSFQAFVTAMRIQLGEERTAEWLKGILANEARTYPKNSPIVAAVGVGEIEVGFVNHYYLHQAKKDKGADFPAANYHPKKGDPGALINVAGVGILGTAKNRAGAEAFADYLLDPLTQRYFADTTFEYPLAKGIATFTEGMTPILDIDAPRMDLSRLSDLKGTLKLLQETGVLK